MNFEYPKRMHFHCLKCGICCGDTKEKDRHILLLSNEAAYIAKKLCQPISDFATKIKNRSPYKVEMKKKENGKCTFLEKNQCIIYSFRPLICRFYPFEMKGGRDKKYVFIYTDECPGIDKGRELKEIYFRRMFHVALDEFSSLEGLNVEASNH
jgi:Fe-S-cluster containining protein